MMTAEKLVAGYQNGAVTRLHLFLDLACSVTERNVEAIMSQVPAELCDAFEQWVFRVPVTGGIVLGNNLSDAEAERTAAERTRPAETAVDW